MIDGESNFLQELLLLLRWLGNAEKQCYEETILLLRVGLIIFERLPLLELENCGLFICISDLLFYCNNYSLISIILSY
jgi:hypothetical protein